MTNKEHVFSHLGKPPYQFLGVDELVFTIEGTGINRAGGGCDHCGTCIRYAFYFLSADGKKFKVGSSCVNKSGDAGMRKVVTKEIRERKAEKEKSELPMLKDTLIKEVSCREDVLRTKPHPYHFDNLSLYDYMMYVIPKASNTKLKRMLSGLKKL